MRPPHVILDSLVVVLILVLPARLSSGERDRQSSTIVDFQSFDFILYVLQFLIIRFDFDYPFCGLANLGPSKARIKP